MGAIYTGKITELLDRGVMIELHPAMDPVFLHNTQLDSKKVSHPSVLGLHTGQDLQVKYFGRDPSTGQVRISMKALTVGAASAVKNFKSSLERSVNNKGSENDISEFTKDVQEKNPSSSLQMPTRNGVANPVIHTESKDKESVNEITELSKDVQEMKK